MAAGPVNQTKGDLNGKLRRAIASGNFAKVSDLLKEGANPKRELARSWLTPLHLAAAHANPGVCQLLIDAGAKVDAADSRGNTPLILAASRFEAGYAFNKGRLVHRSTAKATCAVLLEAGADLALGNRDGDTPMHAAANSCYGDILRMLLRRGGDPNAKNRSGEHPLHKAAFSIGDPASDSCRILLEAGADPNAKSDNQWTPLHYAAMSLHGLGAIPLLLEAGAGIEARTKFRETPLYIAASWGQRDACEKLIEAGADLFAVDYRGMTPKDAAAEMDQDSLAEMLSAEMVRLEMMAKVRKPKPAKAKAKRPVGPKGGL